MMSTPTGSPTLPRPLPPSPPSQPFFSAGVPTPNSPMMSMPAASPTTSRRGLGLSERPVRRFSNPTSELGEPATPIYQPSPQSEGGLRAIAKRHGEREFFQARDAINMSPTPSLPSSATLPRNNSSTSLVDYGPRNGDRSYRRVASFNAAPLDFDPLPSDVKTRRRTMHEIFSTGRREQMDMALHYDVCDELSRTASSTPHVAANDSDLGSGMPDGHEEDTPLLSRPPSPPPSSPSQQSRDVNEQYEPDPAYYRARLESEIAMLSAHVGALTHQLFQVRAMCHDLYATRAPPMIPYCTVPHVSPGMPFFSTVHCAQCDSQMRLELVSRSVNAPYELALVRSTPLV